MPAETVNLPFTGTGDASAQVAVDSTPQGVVELVKLAVSKDGSSVFIPADLVGLFVQEGAESPQDDLLVATALTAGSNIDLDATDIPTGKIGVLTGIDVGGSIPLRCDIQLVNGSRVTRTTIYTMPNDSKLWRPTVRRQYEIAGGVGKHFAVSVTNLSPARTADARATIYWDERTP
jgi:hypothetical protein